MDIAELLEAEKRKEAAAEEEKLQRKLEYQLRFVDQEKLKWMHQIGKDIKREEITLRFLRNEKDREIGKYLATKSETIDEKYKKQEKVVRDLIKTTDVVKNLLNKEKEATKQLARETANVEDETWAIKKRIRAKELENSKFYVPCETKMNNRVAVASGRFQDQLRINRELEAKIDDVMSERKKCFEDERKLQNELKELNNKIANVVSGIGDLYEQRDRMEATKLKVQDHLQKVKNRYHRELVTVTLALCDDQKTDMFMRTKHKDITQNLIKQREEEMAKVKEICAQLEEFQDAFKKIKLVSGEEDINKVIKRFIDNEDDNFSTFLNIGEFLRDNEELRLQIADIRNKNVKLESSTLDFMHNCSMTIKDLQAQTAAHKKKSEICTERLAANSLVLDNYIANVLELIKILDIPQSELKDVVGPTGEVMDTKILPCMTLIEAHVADLLDDYYLVELSIRARSRRPNAGEPSEDEQMMTRVPSLRIAPATRNSMYSQGNTVVKPDTTQYCPNTLLPFKEFKQMVVTDLMEELEEVLE